MIKRGMLVVWHRPPFTSQAETKVNGRVKRDEDGNVVMHDAQHPAEDFKGKCYGVIKRAGRPTMALVMLDGYSKVNELELSQLEERR